MYYYSIVDDNGFTHSIDNCILNYYLLCSLDYALKYLHDKGSSRKEYWEKLNCSSCPKYCFYQNHIHYDEGIYLKVGHYSDYDKKKKEFRLLPMICIEVNPNKHFEKESFKEILSFVERNCTSGELIRYDYAIDVEIACENVQIFNSRKEKGLYKGTRYFGQRNSHGFCKIYDKGKEREIDKILTRIEHTLDNRKKISLEKFYYLNDDAILNHSELKSLNKAVVAMALKMRSLGIDCTEELGYIERHTRAKLEPYLQGSYIEYEYDVSIIKRLLEEVKKLFFVNDIEVDADGFLQFDGESPFDI